MILLEDILKRSEDCTLPHADPVSDSSASSGDSDSEFFRSHEKLDEHSLSLQLDVVGDEVRETCINTKRHVSFGELQVRKYCIILGDNPCCEMGPPLTIDWEYCKSKCMPIDDYESKRGPRRTRDELLMGWIQRKQVLRKLACATDEEMVDAACEAHRIREQRKRTYKSLRYESLHLKLESIIRKLRRFCGKV